MKSPMGGKMKAAVVAAFAVTAAAFAAVAETVATATWKSGGDRDPANPANWECKDAGGNIIAGVLPTDDTVITISGETDFNLPAGKKIHAKSLIFADDVKLTQDADWSGMIAGAAFGGSYTPLEYLFAPNGSYIDTEFAPNGNTKMTMDVEVQGNQEYWWGIWDDAGKWYDQVYCMCLDNWSEVYTAYGNAGGGLFKEGAPALEKGARITVTLDKNHATVIGSDGTVYLDANRTGDVQDFQLEHDIWLFVQNRADSAFCHSGQVGVKMYSCQIWDNGKLVRNFVPAKDENGTICLYETEGNQFYYDKKAGSNFTGGAEGTPAPRATSDHAIALNADAVIDLNGKKLTMDGAALNGSFGEITSLATGGMLEVNVAEGTIATVNSLALSGNMKFVKKGNGTLGMNRPKQTYNGGLDIMAGLVKPIKASGYKEEDKYSLAASGSTITIYGGGALDVNGMVNYQNFHFVLAGGSIVNSVRMSWPDYTSLKYLELTADSTISADQRFSISEGGIADINLGGNVLTVDMDTTKNDNYLWINGARMRNGTLFLSHGKLSVLTKESKFLTLDSGSDDLNLIIGGTLMLGRNMTVCDLSLVDGAAFAKDDFDRIGKLLVRGVFAPTSQAFPDIVMQSGSTLDISDFEGLFKVNSMMELPADAVGKLAFAENAKISVKVASGLVSGTRVIEWDVADKPVAEFSFVGDNTAAVVKDDGLYYGGDASSKVVTRAKWTGAMGDGDLANPGNWTCYNENGNIVDGVTPDNDSKVVFDVPTLNVNIPAGAEIGYGSVSIESSTTLSANCDLRGANQLAFADGITVDTAGHTLYVSRLVGNFTVTDSTDSKTGEPGKLVVDVPETAPATTETVVLAGNLRLVKEGAGTLELIKQGQTMTGGLEINGGLVKAPLKVGDFGSVYGPNTNVLTLNAGGSFDFNGCYDFSGRSFVFAGGTLINTGWQEWPGLTTFGTATFTADTAFEVKQRYPIHGDRVRAHIDLGGKTLTVNVDETVNYNNLYIDGNVEIKNGTLVCNGFTDFCSDSASWQSAGYLGAPDFNLVLNGKYSCEMPMVVGNLTFGPDATLVNPCMRGRTDNGNIKVYGTFAPTSQSFPDIVMQNGSTLDLRGLGDTLAVASSIAGHVLGFAENAKISVNVAEGLEAGAKLIAWASKPAADFALVGDAEVTLAATSDGLYYGADPTSPEIDKATWIGEGDPGDWTDARNWDCRNAAGVRLTGRKPDTAAKVTYTAPMIDLVIPEGAGFECASFVIAESTQLSADTTLTGVSRLSFADGVVIDTCGYKLTLNSLACDGSFMITNSLEATTNEAGDAIPNVGELHLVVDAENTLSTETVALGGNLKVVKEGEGTLAMVRPGQTYSAGLDIRAGLVQPLKASGYSGDTKYSLAGMGSTITVYEGGAVDMNGMVNYQNFHFVLAGGSIVSTAWMNWPDYTSLKYIDLTEDSFINVDQRFSISDGGIADINLGGKTLTVDVSTARADNYLWLNLCQVRNGTLLVNSGKLCVSSKEKGAKTLDRGSEDLNVIVNGTFMLGADMTVSNLTFNAGAAFDCDDWGGDAANPKAYGQFLVGGCYKPNATVVPVKKSGKAVALLKDGATLDLSALTEPLDCSTIAFADDATIKITCGETAPTATTKLVSWTDAPGNLPWLKFETAGALKQGGWSIVAKPDGIYVQRGGFLLFVR